MQMMRRTVLAMMSAAVLDVEALLWKPGKLISIPSPSMVAPNHLRGWLYSFNGQDLIASNKGVFMIVSPSAAQFNSSVVVMSGTGLRHMPGPIHPKARSLDMEVELRGSGVGWGKESRNATRFSFSADQKRYSGWIE